MRAEFYKESVSYQAQSLNRVYMFRVFNCDGRFSVSMLMIHGDFA
jgi:hypothetical protein